MAIKSKESVTRAVWFEERLIDAINQQIKDYTIKSFEGKGLNSYDAIAFYNKANFKLKHFEDFPSFYTQLQHKLNESMIRNKDGSLSLDFKKCYQERVPHFICVAVDPEGRSDGTPPPFKNDDLNGLLYSMRLLFTAQAKGPDGRTPMISPALDEYKGGLLSYIDKMHAEEERLKLNILKTRILYSSIGIGAIVGGVLLYKKFK